MRTLVAEWGHASYTCSHPQAHSRTLRAGQEHAGDRAVFGLLRGGGAPRAPAIPAARHVGSPDTSVWAQDAAHRGAEATTARIVVRAARCHPGRVGRPPGPFFPHFHDRSLVAAAGLEVKKKLWPPPNAIDPTWPQEGPAGMSSWPPNRWPLWCLWTKAEL